MPARIAARIAHLLPPGAEVVTLDAVKLPDALLTNRARYLDKLNFATNFVFFRDADGLSTRLVSANYWAGYGGGAIRLWLRLFDAAGTVLATWEQEVPAGPCGFSIDSRAVRERFGLPPFTGQLFVHAIGAAGHDVVKYALDTYASDNGASLSCTHDANAWPSDRYAGLPAPRDDERVILWLQNSHATPIPAGAVALDRMGAERPVALDAGASGRSPPSRSMSRRLLPDLRWPAQIELRAGRHVVRPRYEVTRGERVRIAHVNVERGDLQAGSGDRRSARAAGPRLSAAVPGAAARALPQHRAADADGGVADDAAAAARRVRRGGDARWRSGSSAACARDHDVALDVDDVAVGTRRTGLRLSRRRRGGWLAARAVPLRGPAVRPRRGIQLRRAHLQHGDDLPRRAAILFRPAAGADARGCSSSWAMRGGAASRC